MVDGHVHLENGDLSVEYVMEFVEQAKRMGITRLHILDHTHRFIEYASIYERLKQCDERQKNWLEPKLKESIKVYHNLIETMKQMDVGVELKFGLEVCYACEDQAFLREQLAKYPYDFIIGSIHSIDGRLYDMAAFSKAILWDVFDVDDIYKRYYEIMEDMISSGLFTQIGHPDQLKLFHHQASYDLIPTYQKIAKLAKKHQVKMECNTGINYRYHHEDLGTNDIFMKILLAEGVEIISASDAHQPKHVGMLIQALYDKWEGF